MGKQKKITFWVITGLGTLLVLLLVLVLVLPRLIDLTPVKENILADISRTVGGEVKCQRVDLSFFPRPRVVVHQLILSVPEKLTGNVESVTVYPEILPLLMVKVRLAMLQVEAPTLTINLTERKVKNKVKNKERPKASSTATIEQKMAPVLALLASKAPDLVVEVENGRLSLSQEKQSVLAFKDIHARISLSPKGIKIDTACESNLWESISLKAWLDLRILEGNSALAADESPPLVSLDLEGKEVDVHSTRDAALVLAGDIATIRDVFDIVKGGKMPLITVNAKGNRITDLGEMENIVIAGSLLDGQVFVPGAKLDLEEVNGEVVISKGILEGRNIEARLGNSLVRNGTLKLGLADLNSMDISLEGDMGSEAVQWISGLILMPPALKVRSPLSISRGHLTWHRGAKTSFAGDIVVQDGPKVFINVIDDPEELVIKDLVIQDKESHAHLKLNVKKKAFDLEFSGHVTETTMHNLFENDYLSQGWIKGDFRAHILMDQPTESTAQGILTGRDLIFPWKLGVPLKIESVSLDATKNNVKVEPAVFILADKRLILKGGVKVSAAGFVLDMDISADGLEWDQLEKILEKDNGEDAGPDINLWGLPVQGVLRLKSETFKYETFTWTPLHADISFAHNVIDVAVTEANLCGISTPGVLKISPRELLVDFKPLSKDQELAPTIACLEGKKGRVTGIFDFNGEVIGRGKSEELARSLNGDLEFVAHDGRVYRDVVLVKIFGFLNVTKMFMGEFPDFSKKGFAYNSITAKANLKDGKLVIKEAILDAPSMQVACHGDIDLIEKKMNLEVLVAPLETVDSIVKKIPLVNYILGGTLVSVPLKVTGDPADPKVTPLAASAVGAGLLGIVERTLKLPVKIIEAVD